MIIILSFFVDEFQSLLLVALDTLRGDTQRKAIMNVVISNWEIKRILEKIVQPNRKDWIWVIVNGPI